MNIYVIRNGQRFGPYTEQTLLSYVNQGQILVHDKAIRDTDTVEQTAGFYLRQAGLKCRIPNKGNIVSQLKSIGSELIFPKTTMLSKSFLTDQRFLILAIVGLLPMVIMNMPFGGFLLFYEVALYFSIIWGLFFYTCFKTDQVKLKTTMAVFFLTQAFVFALMSGIAFGVYEGVGYQMTVNAQQEYDVSFFLNIARLTSLPFLHACWCGIAGYFLAFAHLYPKYRRGLYVLAIGIPMLIHGLYDTFANVRILPLILVFIGLMLLMVYLKHGVNYQSKLRQ